MQYQKTTLLGISLVLVSSVALGAQGLRRTYATFSNPASLSQMSGDDKNAAQIETTADQRLKLSLYVAPVRTSYKGTATSPLPAFGSRNGSVSGKVTNIIPQGSYTQRINKDWVVGLEVGDSFYGHSLFPSSNDFSTLGYFPFPVEAKLKVFDISPEVSYRVNKMLVLGAGIDVSRASLKMHETLGTGSGFKSLNANVDAWGWGYHFGVVVHPWLGGYLGLSYYSKIKFALKGTSTFGASSSNNTKLDTYTPYTLSANIFQALTRQIGLNFGIHYTHWSVIKHLNLENLPGGHSVDQDKNFSNTWAYGLSARYQVIEPLVLGVGAAYNTSPSNPVHAGPHSLQKKHYWNAGLSAAYQFNSTLTLALDYAHEFISKHTISNAKYNGEVNGSANQFSGTIMVTF